ncbi:MAG: methyltransferase [Gemmatimonadetes bacterium]|nr:methyltransferase [Gemmatimonadota bacterium]
MSLRDGLARRLLPLALRRWWRRTARVDMGDLRRMEPVSRLMGLDRGGAICRWYIERFLDARQTLIRGRVLEVADREYTTRFGGARVTASDVLHAVAGNAAATIVGDLATGEGIPVDRYDAVILTQVLQCIFDVSAAVRHVHASLRPGGSALITVPAIAAVSRYDAERWGEYWHFTEQSVRRLLEPVFGADQVTVTAYGNHVAAHAYLAGMSAEELSADELAARDADYPVLITAVATRAASPGAPSTGASAS